MSSEPYPWGHSRASAHAPADQVAKTETLRRSRYGQVRMVARIVIGLPWYARNMIGPLPDTSQGRGILRALLALGITGPEAMRWGRRYGPEVVQQMIDEVDDMTSLDITGGWLGNQVELESDVREYFDLWHLWPAGWTSDQIEQRAAARAVDKKRVKRAEEKSSEDKMDYPDRVRQRVPALLKLIPADRAVTIADLTHRTAGHKLFTDANGRPIKPRSRRAIITRILSSDAIRKVTIRTETTLPNGRPRLHIARRPEGMKL